MLLAGLVSLAAAAWLTKRIFGLKQNLEHEPF
jgi:hypothetical protein